MTWLDKLERRFGFLAFPGLMRIVVGFTALVFALVLAESRFSLLCSISIRRGSATAKSGGWSLTFSSRRPPALCGSCFALWFLWFIGDGLERAWGAFRLTLYFLVGMIGTTAAAFSSARDFRTAMLIASLFFAFARFYPDQVIYILFILPVKIKWLAWVSARVFAA